MKKLIKKIFSIQTLKTLLTVFIFLSWYVNTFSGNTIVLSVFLFIAVFCTNVPFSRYALCKAILGIVFFLLFREFFLTPNTLFSLLSEPFTWWNQQSACCGTVSVFVSILLVELIKNNKE